MLDKIGFDGKFLGSGAGLETGTREMETRWIGTGWKMTKSLAEARAFTDVLRTAEAKADPCITRFVIPPFPLLREVKAMLAETSILLGAQNMHWEDAGPWTGEVSAPMLLDCGVEIVELGHSERREFFNETDETVGLKVAAALRHRLIPLVCVGETAGEKAAGQASDRLAAQVIGALAHAPKGAEVVFAYEPIWAIGDAGTSAAPDYADAQIRVIKQAAARVLGAEPRCLYGGSVDQQNCTALLTQPNIDGLFIGRAAWDAAGYMEILKRCGAVI